MQRYCDFLHHRYLLAVSQGRDVSNDEAFDSWIDAGRPGYDLDIAATGGKVAPDG